MQLYEHTALSQLLRSGAKARMEFSRVISREVSADLEDYLNNIKDHSHIINTKLGKNG